MEIKKFIQHAKELLDLDDFSEDKKKKAIKKLLRKLEKRKDKVKVFLHKKPGDRQRKEAKEELELIRYHIKKGKKLLAKLEKK